MGNLSFAIDYDDTITEYRPFPEKAPLSRDAVKFIKRAYQKGHTLYLWTARDKEYYYEALKTLKESDLLKYFSSLPESGMTGKISADFYIDDRSYPNRKIDWKEWFYIIGEKDD